MLGREVALPVELMLGPPVTAVEESVTSSEYVAQFAERCEKAFRIAREHTSLAQQRQKRNYDARIFKKANPFSVNDKAGTLARRQNSCMPVNIISLVLLISFSCFVNKV
ncbi:hypothetical protein HOLleu_10539 [Holothuria leucospilota]|uniref:Uncharacterized protein n=1 Tax=Holothuria leucospilota TaxID=206669 RepID=A0A9Q1H913_HOLLE|nr:hypothetical protein HOLleu_17702 [Holothuria leucospilota]KAJ8043454.1 hypothetical protein HOLleu_10539 [Holothuria leucospilota]